MQATTARTTKGRTESEGRAPGKENAALENAEASTLSIAEATSSVNGAISPAIGASGIQIVPATNSPALARAHVYDVLVNGQRIGGVCFARGAWRILSNAQARFASRDHAVEALLTRKGRSK